jgi:hypothetical protein
MVLASWDFKRRRHLMQMTSLVGYKMLAHWLPTITTLEKLHNSPVPTIPLEDPGFLFIKSCPTRPYHGHVHEHPDSHGTIWRDTSRHHPGHIRYVYMPDNSKAACHSHLSPSALTSLSQDIHRFDSQPGYVACIGNFNARVGRCRLSLAARTLPPAFGEPVTNTQVNHLQWCETNHMAFISSPTPPKPCAVASTPCGELPDHGEGLNAHVSEEAGRHRGHNGAEVSQGRWEN